MRLPLRWPHWHAARQQGAKVSGPPVNLSVIPTGGAVLMQFYGAETGHYAPPSGATQMVISRAVSGVAGTTTLYSGGLLASWVDAGDGPSFSNAPLSSGLAYLWTVTDNGGATQIGPATPASSITTQPDALTQLLIRLLQGGINSLVLPPGIAPTNVTTQMPQGGWQAMPFIVVNLDLIQQSETQIGEDVVNPNPGNDWSLWVNAKRIWRVSVMSTDAEERDFYRDSLLSIFRVLKATVFSPIGYNVTHSFQAASYTSATERDGHTPGFYGADLMLEIDGEFNTAVLTNYGLINEITVGVTITQPALAL